MVSFWEKRKFVKALADFATAQAAAGDVGDAKESIAQALATAETIEDAEFRVDALVEIAALQAETGDVGGAFATAETIKNADDRAETLANIAKALAKME